MFLLAQIFMIFTHRELVNKLAAVLLHPNPPPQSEILDERYNDNDKVDPLDQTGLVYVDNCILFLEPIDSRHA